MALKDVRAKGANGEREVIALLEPIVRKVLQEMGHPLAAHPGQILQRNQNQSAVGGSDLTNTFGLSVEVKRQETLAVNEWWRQCCEAAARNNERPVLLYRQNQKKWRAVMMMDVVLPVATDFGLPMSIQVRGETDIDSFLSFFKNHVTNMLAKGYELRV